MKDVVPVLLMVELDHDVPHFHQALRNGFIVPNLIGFVVVWAVNVDRGIVLTVVEVRPSRARLDEVLPVGWGS